MKYSLSWLQDFVQIRDDLSGAPALESFCETFSEKIAEIDSVEQGEPLHELVVVGEILDINAHPDADKVRVTQVRTSEDGPTHQIICGARNIEVGQRVPVALPGALLPGEFLISERKMRGVMSAGMLCSAPELGIEGDDSGIWILPGQTPLGQQVRSLLPQKDTILEVENVALTQRPDLFCQRGIARELVAAGLAQWNPSDAELQDPASGGGLSQKISIPPELCPYWVGIELTGVSTVESPSWMQERLIALGERPINLLVDITNYVMLEEGMPLHAFDLQQIEGDMTFRLSQKGETVTTLDGEELSLPDGLLVLSDERGVFDLCGVMGGLRSSIREDTTHIMIHAPVYPGEMIRSSMKATGKRTLASTIYEKQVPAVSADRALARVMQILEEAFGDDLENLSGKVTFGQLPEAPEPIVLEGSLLSRIAGTAIDPEQVRKILVDLGCTVESQGDGWSVQPPLWRLRDLKIPEDLVEEIMRHRGYSQIGSEPLSGVLSLPRRLSSHVWRDHIQSTLLSLGAQEIVTIPMLSAESLSALGFDPDSSVALANPLSEEMALMRPHILPRMIQALARYPSPTTLYEQGICWSQQDSSSPQEHQVIELLSLGHSFSQIRSTAATLLSRLNPSSLRWSPGVPDDLGPLLTQGLTISYRGREIGHILRIPPSLLDQKSGSSETEAYWTKINTSLLLEAPELRPQLTQKPLYPGVERDVAFLMPLDFQVGGLVQFATKRSSLASEVSVQEVYTGEGVTDGEKSVLLRFLFRSPDRTLTHEEVEAELASLLPKLEKQGVRQRYSAEEKE